MRTFLKYELKNNWKDFLISYILVLASFIIFSIFVLFTKNLANVTPIITILLSNFIILVVGAMIASFILFVINIVKSLYTSIFSDEGYLTLSFPKTTDALILSKLVAQLIWVVFYALVTLIGVSIVFLAGMGATSELFEDIKNIISMSSRILRVAPFYLINCLLQFLVMIITLMLSFSLINMGSTIKHKLILGLLIFVGISQITTMISTFLNLIPFGIALTGSEDLVFTYGMVITNHNQDINAGLYLLNFTDVIFKIGLIIGGYFLLRFIMNKKLELE